MRRRIFSSWVVAAAGVATLCASPALADHLDFPNRLVDGGFEGAPTFDGAPFVGTWEGFNGGPGSSIDFTTNMPRTGAQSLELNIDNTPNTFAGTFQEIRFDPSLAGNAAYFSGWHKALSGPGGSEIRIEWRDSVNDVEISRTDNLTPVIGSDYEEFILMTTIPAGADSGRAVYAIQSFGGPATQQVFVDDVNFNVAPEPASFVLATLAGLAVLRRSRRG